MYTGNKKINEKFMNTKKKMKSFDNPRKKKKREKLAQQDRLSHRKETTKKL